MFTHSTLLNPWKWLVYISQTILYCYYAGGWSTKLSSPLLSVQLTHQVSDLGGPRCGTPGRLLLLLWTVHVALVAPRTGCSWTFPGSSWASIQRSHGLCVFSLEMNARTSCSLMTRIHMSRGKWRTLYVLTVLTTFLNLCDELLTQRTTLAPSLR